MTSSSLCLKVKGKSNQVRGHQSSAPIAFFAGKRPRMVSSLLTVSGSNGTLLPACPVGTPDGSP
eukprot:2073394-Prorocentrum_lima.AAC.1